MSEVQVEDELYTNEDRLYDQMKELPDFKYYPIPMHWYKKYNIPLPTITNTKEFLESNHTFNCMFAPKDLPAIIIDGPQRDLSGNIIQINLVEEEPIKVETIIRPYDPKKRYEIEDST